MSKEKTTTVTGGIGFTGLLTILFVALKLTKVIAWSWWWVISPIWVSFGLGIVFVIIGVIMKLMIPKSIRIIPFFFFVLKIMMTIIFLLLK